MERILIEFGVVVIAISILVFLGRKIVGEFRTKSDLQAAEEHRKLAEQRLRIATLEAETAKLEVQADITRNSILDAEIGNAEAESYKSEKFKS